MTISGDTIPNANNSSDNDVKDETYVPSPRAPICDRGKGLASGSGGGSGTVEIMEENEEAESDGEEEFDVEEITPPSYPTWRVKVSY
jgi:hypothetical protein